MQHQPDLARFHTAQQNAYSYALSEITNGKKTTHWMWFIFPQLLGLGNSEMAKRYAIHNKHEAEAYLDDPVLGARLREISEALLTHKDKTASQVMGPDDVKLRSCMTLFATLPNADPVFKEIINAFFSGEEDRRTLELLSGSGS